MVEIEMGKYLNVEATKPGDIAEITEEGSYEEKEIKGKKKKLLDIPCKIGDREMIYSPPWKVQKIFIEAWGKEPNKKNTLHWVGKKFTIEHKEIEIAGEDKLVVRAVPLIAEKVQ